MDLLAAVSAFSTGQDFKSFSANLVGLINSVIPLMASIALVLFLWSGARFIFVASNPKAKTQNKGILLWSAFAMFVLFSIGGILKFLEDSLLH